MILRGRKNVIFSTGVAAGRFSEKFSYDNGDLWKEFVKYLKLKNGKSEEIGASDMCLKLYGRYAFLSSTVKYDDDRLALENVRKELCEVIGVHLAMCSSRLVRG